MRKRLYSLVLMLIMFLLSIYVRVSAKMPVYVYVNGNRIETDKVSYLNTPGDVKIMYNGGRSEGMYIVLQKNNLEYDVAYNEEDREINFILNDNGFYDLKVYFEKDGKTELYTFSICVDKQEADVQFLVNANEIESYVYDSPIMFEILCDDDHIDITNSFVSINDNHIKMEWQQQEDNTFIARILFDKIGRYKVEVAIRDLADNVNNKVISFQIGNLTDFEYKINNKVVSEEMVFYNEDVLFEIQENKVDNDENEIELYINNEFIAVDWIETDSRNKIAKINLTEEGAYNICVVYKNTPFNSIIFEKKLVIDKTKPIIQYRFSDDSQKEYVSDKRELFIDVKEKYLDKNSLELVVKKDSEIYQVMPIWKVYEKSYEISVTFYEEGKYEVFAIIKDYAGNVGIWDIHDTQMDVFKSTFTLDWTSPKIELQGIISNSILNSNQELTFVTYDDNFAFYEIFATRNGEEYELSIPKRDHKQLSHIQLFEEQSVGYYEIYVKAYDLAGNIATSDLLSFTIDVKPPEVFIWLDYKLYNEGIRYLSNKSMNIRVETNDYVLSSQKISIVKNGIEILKQLDNESNNKKLFTYQIEDESFIENDYQLQIEVMDVAGNAMNKVVPFKLNSQSPTIHILNDIFEGNPKRGPWTPKIHYEWEQSHITDFTLTRNNVMMDYVWGTPIINDGEYVLEVFARDLAGNSITFSEAFSFVIDNTPPQILIQDRNRNKVFTNMRFYHMEKLKIQTENRKDNILSIMVNDILLDLDKYKVVDGETLSYVVDSMNEGENVIEVRASDLAGNITHEVIRIFIDVTSNIEYKNTICILTFILCSFSISIYLLWTRTCKLHF